VPVRGGGGGKKKGGGGGGGGGGGRARVLKMKRLGESARYEREKKMEKRRESKVKKERGTTTG